MSSPAALPAAGSSRHLPPPHTTSARSMSAPTTPAPQDTAEPVTHAPADDVVIDGWLQKKPKAGVKGLRVWKQKYFVLLRSTNELRYYGTMVLPPHCRTVLPAAVHVPVSTHPGGTSSPLSTCAYLCSLSHCLAAFR